MHFAKVILEHLDLSDNVEARIWETVASLICIYRKQGRLEEALGLHADLFDRFPTPQIRNEQEIRVYGALLQRSSGVLLEAESTYRSVIRAWSALYGSENISTLRAIDGLASVDDMLGLLPEAEADFEQVLEAYKKMLGPNRKEKMRRAFFFFFFSSFFFFIFKYITVRDENHRMWRKCNV